MGCRQPLQYPEREMIHSNKTPSPDEDGAGRRGHTGLFGMPPATRLFGPALARLVLQFTLLSLPALVGARCPLEATADNFAFAQPRDFSYSCSRPAPMTGNVVTRWATH